MFSFIELDELIEKFEAYKNDSVGNIACAVISPSQSVYAYLTKPEERHDKDRYNIVHDDILGYILGEMYDIGSEIDLTTEKGRAEKQLIVAETIPRAWDNFVNLRFDVNSTLNIVTISIPYYINRRQYDALIILNEKLNRAGLNVYVGLSNYNPISREEEDTRSIFLDNRSPRIHLSLAIRILKLTNRIVDYDLSLGEERIVKEQVQPNEKII